MCLLFAAIVMPRGTVDAIIDVYVGRAVSVRIPCNGDMNRVPRGFVSTDGLASEGVQVISYFR